MTPQEEYDRAKADMAQASADMEAAGARMAEAGVRLATASRKLSTTGRMGRASGGVSVGSIVFGDHGGIVADEITGGIHTSVSIGTVNAGEVVVGGRIISGGYAKTCVACGGQTGWRETGGVMYHIGCGARQ